jgi:hypothetical protein
VAGTLVFIHGTGVRDVSGSMAQIRDGASRILGWTAGQVFAIEWGKAVGPQDLDIGLSLPLEDATKGLGDDVSEDEATSALWELLLADPIAELRVLAEGPLAVSAVFDPTAEPADEAIRGRVAELTVPPELLARTGLSRDELDVARAALAAEPNLVRAAASVGDAGDRQLATAIAHALVAAMLRNRDDPAKGRLVPPRAAYDAATRDDLVESVEASLSPVSTKGLAGDLVKKVIAPLATRVAVRKREAFMGPLGDFIRDVAFYIEHGALVRDYLAGEIRKYADSDPVIVLAHSLGGIAAVDLLADPAVMRGGAPLKVDLLVTVGSQAPLLYLMDALYSLGPRPPLIENKPFLPWLNIYNRQDLLSFCAERVFVNSPEIIDEPISAGVPFPMSHSAYWAQDRVYQLVRDHLPA